MFLVIIVIPLDMPTPHRQSMEMILKRLYVASPGSAVVGMVWTSSRYEEFSSLDEVTRRIKEGKFPAVPSQEK
jgi:hypothetical protein